MSMSKIIQGGKQKAELWTVPNVEGEVGLTSASQEEKLSVTAESLEKVQEQAYKEAYEEGFEKGYEKGMQSAGERIADLLGVLDKALRLLADPFQQLDKQVEKEVVALSGCIAKRLVLKQLNTEPENLVEIVKEAVSVLPISSREVIVYLEASDAQLLRENLPKQDEPVWKIVEDPAMKKGDCRVSSNSTTVDASLDARLNSVLEQILQESNE